MKTVLYTQDKVKTYPEGYRVNGVIQPLGDLGGVWHLEVVETEEPEPTEKHNLSYEFVPDYENNKYVQVWTLHEKTPEELMGWKLPDYGIRIVAPKALVFDDMGAKMFAWFHLNELPVHSKDKDTSCLYCNEILPEHQPLLSSFSEQGVVVEYKKPYLMNNNTKEIHRRSDKVAACNAHLIVNKSLLDDVELRQALTDGADGCGHCLPEFNNNEGSHLDSGFSEENPAPKDYKEE